MEHLTNFFKLLSDPTRLRIIILLLENELCVCQLMGAMGMSQPRVSRQLALLKSAGLVKDRREGKWIYYRVKKDDGKEYVKVLLELIPQWVKGETLCQIDIASLKACFGEENRTGKCDIKTFESIHQKIKNTYKN